MARELDCRSEVRVEGPLVSPPEFDYTDKGQPRCRLVFPKKCSGKGEINEKPYWLQFIAFDDLAIQANMIRVGSIVAVIGVINANRWYAKDGVTVKTSQNYIARRIGVIKSLAEPPEWLPGAPAKVRALKRVAKHVEASVDDIPEAADFDEPLDWVNSFLHPELRQAAPSVPGGDDAEHGAEAAEVQGEVSPKADGVVPGTFDGHLD
jgi:hypothetical protein